MSPGKSLRLPFGTMYLPSRLIIMTSCPSGSLIELSVLPAVRSCRESVRVYRDVECPSASSTPKSDSVVLVSSINLRRLAEDKTVVPWITSDSSVTKNTILNI